MSVLAAARPASASSGSSAPSGSSTSSTSSGWSGALPRWRGPAAWLIILALVVAVAAIGGRGGSKGPPLDPNSTSPQGAKALALLVGQLGTGVDLVTGPPAPGSGGVALILLDRLEPAAHRQLVAWVRAGGTLVAADPGLVLSFAAPTRNPGPGGLVGIEGTPAADCSSPAVKGVQALDIVNAVALRPPAGATGCFRTPEGGAFLVIMSLGAGQLVLLGGPEVWTNARLGRHDNSVLAANLLAARPDGPHLQWIVGPRAGGGHKSLLQLMAPRVKEGLLQLLVAVALLALWRARRLGRPVIETPLVELPGSELVVAVGNLLQHGGRLDDAAAILRATLRRGIVDQLGVAHTAGPEAAAVVVAQRTGLDRDMILATIAGPVPASEAELVTLARQADTIRQEMAHAR